MPSWSGAQLKHRDIFTFTFKDMEGRGCKIRHHSSVFLQTEVSNEKLNKVYRPAACEWNPGPPE